MRALIDAELARARAYQIGRATVSLPDRPVLNPEPVVEAKRQAEYAAFRARCEAEAAVWNAEATRWHEEREDIAAAIFRIDVTAQARSPAGLGRSNLECAGDGDDDESNSGSSSLDADPDEDRNNATAAAQLMAMDMLSGEMGLATSSTLSKLVEESLMINEAVGEAHDRVRWLNKVAERTRAIRTVRAQQQHEFIEAWKARAAEEAAAERRLHEQEYQ